MTHPTGQGCRWAETQHLIASVSRGLLDRHRDRESSVAAALDEVVEQLGLGGVAVFAGVRGEIVVEGLRIRGGAPFPSLEGRPVDSTVWLPRIMAGESPVVLEVDDMHPEVAGAVKRAGHAGATMVAVPLWRGREVTGLLVAIDPLRREWHPAEVNALAATARLVHAAGERHRAEAALRRRLDETTRHRRHVDMVSRAAVRLLASLSHEVDEVVDEVIADLVDHVDARGGAWLWRPVGGSRWQVRPGSRAMSVTPRRLEAAVALERPASVVVDGERLLVVPAAIGAVEGRLLVVAPRLEDVQATDVVVRIADALVDFEEYVVLDQRATCRAETATVRAEIARRFSRPDTDAMDGVGWAVERLGRLVAPATVELVSAAGAPCPGRAPGRGPAPGGAAPVVAVHGAGDDPPAFLVLRGELDPVRQPLLGELVAEMAVEIRRFRDACAARRALADEVRLQQLVADVSRSLVSDAPLDARLDDALELIGRHLDLSAVQLVDLDHDLDRARVRRGWRRSAVDAQGAGSLVEVSPADWCGVATGPGSPPVLDTGGDRATGATRVLVVPAGTGGRPERLVVLEAGPGRRFGEAEAKVVSSLAATIHSAVVAGQAHDLFAVSFDAVPLAQVVLSEGRVLAANRAFHELLGPADGDRLVELVPVLEPVVHGAAGAEPIDVDVAVHLRGREVWLRIHVAHGSRAGQAVTVVTLEDVTAEVERTRRLAHEVEHDQLTGVGNRRALDNLFDEIARTAVGSGGDGGEPGSVGTLVLIDLDRFKVVNDAVGHRVGDHLLVVVAERLRSAVRSVDRVFRFGGDEFVVFLPGADTLEGVAVGERLRRRIAEPVRLEGAGTVIPACSVGLARVGGADPAAALRHADAALATAKSRGRSRIEVFERAHEERLRSRLTLESELQAAVSTGAFEAWYQPEIDLATGEIVAFEALVRWRHPERGIVPASHFIDVAEEMGLAPVISTQVLTRALTDLRGFARDDVGVRVNVTAAQLAAGDLVDDLAVLLEAHEVAPGRLGLEVTERSMLDREAAIATLTRVRRLGVGVAIDDFGTGHSSLGWLKHLPVDTVKIDRSFVVEIVTDPRDRALVEAVLNVAGALGLAVVAEGVEDVQTARVLAEMGVRRAQGWLWSPAVPAEEAIGMLLDPPWTRDRYPEATTRRKP